MPFSEDRGPAPASEVRYPSDALIDFAADFNKQWFLAITNGTRRHLFWLDAYFDTPIGKKPRGYYFDLARIPRGRVKPAA